MKPQVLCLSSGGSKGLAQLGVLARYQMDDMLSDIHTFAGTSIGSLVCVLLNVGYNPAEIAELFFEFKLEHQVGLANLIDEYGFFSMEQLRKKIDVMITQKWGHVPNFKELYKQTGKKLFITTYNIDRMETYYFNYISEPECSISEAVCISMSIPIFFKAYVYKGYRFVDGALGNSFPIELFDNHNIPILGVVVHSDKNPAHSFTNYISRLSEGNTKEYIKLKLKSCKENCLIIEIECEDPDFFIVDIEKRTEIYSMGWMEADKNSIKPFIIENRYTKELIEKTTEICSSNLLPFISTMAYKKPDILSKAILNLPYPNILALYHISKSIQDMSSIKVNCMRKEEKKTLYHHLNRVLTTIVPNNFWSRIPLVEKVKKISFDKIYDLKKQKK